MEHSDVVIRFNGGHNAGHTVVDEKWQEFDLHILPSGSVRSGKINIITSGCVLGLELPKFNLAKMVSGSSKELVFRQRLGDLYKKDDTGYNVLVGLIPELRQLASKDVNVKAQPVKISAQAPIIGVHHVLLDALDEEMRAANWLRKIGSTGSGITRAYESKNHNNEFSLKTLLETPEEYYAAVRALWDKYKQHFPNISAEELVGHARQDHNRLKGLLTDWMIEIIEDEKDYIGQLKNEGKKIVAEGAQWALISANYSPFGTASNPSLETFCQVSGIDPQSVANLFAVFKMPPSSVGTRPKFLAYAESEILAQLRQQYKEFWVSTKRPRDIFGYSLPEFARAMALMIGNVVFPENRIVPVLNRIDGIPDFATLEPDGLTMTTGWKFRWAVDNVLVGIHDHTTSIAPWNALNNYPNRDTMGSEALFGATSDDRFLRKILGDVNAPQTPQNISDGVQYLIQSVFAAMFNQNVVPDAIVWFWPGREDSYTVTSIPVRR